MIRPKIVLSKCFSEAVRYNSEIISDQFVNRLKKYVDYIDFCPEVEIGLPVPRKILIITKVNDKKRLIQPETGIDLTEKMGEYAEKVVNSLKDIDGFILKAKSPSCGVGTTNLYENNKVVGRTYGFFAEKIKEKFPYLPLEDEKRLKNRDIRVNFLTKIFAFADLRESLKEKKAKNLVEFHTRYKYLLMTYSQTHLKKMGQIVASNMEVEKKIEEYKKNFYEAFSKRPTLKKHANTLFHIFGHISDKLNKKEKTHLKNLIEKLSKGKIELKVIIELMRNFAYRFENDYLLFQKYLEPYPEDLDV
ncbi:MAG: DUF523 and DUF1722 domain-containing protein [Candidatus Hydrothermales bacterium]